MESTSNFEKFLKEEKSMDIQEFIGKVFSLLERPEEQKNKVATFKAVQKDLTYDEITLLATKGYEAFLQEKESFNKFLKIRKEGKLNIILEALESALREGKNSQNLN